MSEIEPQGQPFVGEFHKFVGDKNSHEWQSRMKFVLIKQNLWLIVEVKREPTTFLALNREKHYTATTLQEEKNRAHLRILMFVCDEFVDTLMEKLDPTDTWNFLMEVYLSRDQSKIMLINSQFFSLWLQKEGDVKEYVRLAREYKNKLVIQEKHFKTKCQGICS